MSNSFLQAIEEETTKTYTENNSLTYSTSLNCNVDLFFQGSALRGKQPQFIINLFSKAYIENQDLALANLWYLRDIRNGQGERQTARNIFNYIGENYKEIITIEFLDKIAKYGRYDDILSLLNTNEDIVIQYIKSELEKNNSLLAKWLPSINTSSKKTIAYANKVRKGLGLNCGEYRKLLSKLRKEQHLVETSLSSKNYKSINYENIPSKAGLKYMSAFMRNDNKRYTKYLENVKEGRAKINTSVLTPVDIVKDYTKSSWTLMKPDNDDILNTYWNKLPDVFEGKFENSIVVADVSGSMYDSLFGSMKPMSVCLGLALYIAERNKGLFHNHFMTFSEHPQLQYIRGETLFDKLTYLEKSEWGANTNLDKVFEVILESCIKYDVPVEEAPKRIYIISDMEFDASVGSNKTTYERIIYSYNKTGYKIPEVIFWNVNARNRNIPVRFNEQGTALISGYSPNILKYILTEKDITPEKIMLSTLKNYIDN